MAILGKSGVGCSCVRSGGGAKAQADPRRRRPAGQASAGATLELWPRGTWWPRKGPQQGWGEDERARAPAAPGPAPPLAPRQQRPGRSAPPPRAPGPHAARRPLTAAPASVPLAPPQQRRSADAAAAAIFRPPP